MGRSKGIYSIGIMLAVVLTILFYRKGDQSPRQVPIIGITQMIEHSSIDQERHAFIQELNRQGYQDGKSIQIIYRNAQGNMADSTQIAQQLVTHQPNVIVAFSTPSAQTAQPICKDHLIPLVFSTVTDPLKSKLISRLEPPRPELVAGVSDGISIEAHLKLIRDFLPKAKKVGVIYNNGEMNSSLMVSEFQEKSGTYGLEVIVSSVSKSSDIVPALQSLISKKIDAIYIPNDNLVVAAVPSLAPVCLEHKIPLFSGDLGSVEMGALSAAGYDRPELGQKTAQLVIRILKGEAVNTLPIETNHKIIIAVNDRTLKGLGLTLLDKLKSTVRMIEPTS